jgi:D-hydroxyproline dehydrogenase subunit gamma
MLSQFTITIDDSPVLVPSGATVAAAVVIAGQTCRTSVSGERRGPFCGMGICYECRVAINGKQHCRSCQMVCEPGMEVRTQE